MPHESLVNSNDRIMAALVVQGGSLHSHKESSATYEKSQLSQQLRYLEYELQSGLTFGCGP
jgi:hypothetical protein